MADLACSNVLGVVSGVVCMLRGVNGFECIAERLRLAHNSQLRASAMLENHIVDAEGLFDLLLQVQELSRTCELLTVQLV